MSIAHLLTYNISSIYKNNPIDDTDNFSYNFDIPINYWDKLTHLSVIRVQIPKTWYLIQAGYNTFTLIENGVPTVISIPIGCYINVQALSTLTDLMTFYSPNAITYTPLEENSPGFGIFPYPFTGHYTITANTTTLSIQLEFPPSSNLAVVYGMYNTAAGVNTFTVNATDSTLYSPFVYNMTPEQTITMTCDAVKSSNNDNPISNQTLTTIYSGNNPYFTNIVQDYDLITNMKPFNKNSKTISFTLENELGVNSFFINDVNIAFTICFFQYIGNDKHYQKVENLLGMLVESKFR